jgi:hypothetical protein
MGYGIVLGDQVEGYGYCRYGEDGLVLSITAVEKVERRQTEYGSEDLVPEHVDLRLL